MSKFKKGDIITIKDNPDDVAVQNKNKGYYKIIKINSKGYDIYSINYKCTYTCKFLESELYMANIDYENKIQKKIPTPPCHIGVYKSVFDWIDSGFRLATSTEITLYVPKV